jgi:hypothetical protein
MYGSAPKSSHWTLSLERYPLSALTIAIFADLREVPPYGILANLEHLANARTLRCFLKLLSAEE